MKPHIWQIKWLDIVYIYLYGQTYQYIPNVIFGNWPRKDRWTDGPTRWSKGTLRKQTFQWVRMVDFSAGHAIWSCVRCKGEGKLNWLKSTVVFLLTVPKLFFYCSYFFVCVSVLSYMAFFFVIICYSSLYLFVPRKSCASCFEAQ